MIRDSGSSKNGQDRLFSLMIDKPSYIYISFSDFVSICKGAGSFRAYSSGISPG
jgi:hypothetical protein